jgi:hypothetical protein
MEEGSGLMSWWTTATLGDGLVREVVAIVAVLAALAALVTFVLWVVECFVAPAWADTRSPLGALFVVVVAPPAAFRIWPHGHPVGIAFVMVVAPIAVVPIAIGWGVMSAVSARLADARQARQLRRGDVVIGSDALAAFKDAVGEGTDSETTPSGEPVWFSRAREGRATSAAAAAARHPGVLVAVAVALGLALRRGRH